MKCLNQPLGAISVSRADLQLWLKTDFMGGTHLRNLDDKSTREWSNVIRCLKQEGIEKPGFLHTTSRDNTLTKWNSMHINTGTHVLKPFCGVQKQPFSCNVPGYSEQGNWNQWLASAFPSLRGPQRPLLAVVFGWPSVVALPPPESAANVSCSPETPRTHHQFHHFLL